VQPFRNVLHSQTAYSTTSQLLAQKDIAKCDYCDIVLVDDNVQCQVAVPSAVLSAVPSAVPAAIVINLLGVMSVGII
jgi:hypothetical protein